MNSTLGHKVYPAYKQLLALKVDLRCTDIKVNDKGNDIQAPMQSVLEHSVKRLLLPQASDLQENIMVVEGKYQDKEKRYLCYFKYGCDGLSGLTEFH